VDKLLHNSLCGALLLIKPVITQHAQHKAEYPPLRSLLSKFSNLFVEPTTLPPKRKCDRKITLLPEAKVVNQRPYRLPHHQKNILEEIIKSLLQKGVIRGSSSPYSSPVLLVKNKDHTWRKCVGCVGFRKLNQQTIKNEYPIPIIEDLLDELQGKLLQN
jgi:hypothetical protein